MIELSKKSFEHVGCMLGASIVHGGPAPAFFAHAVADYIINGIDCVKAKVEDVPDPSIKNKLKKLLDTSTEEEFHELLGTEDYNFRYDCGISQPIAHMKFFDCEKIVNAFALHFSVIRVKAELDQIINGLAMFGVKQLAEENRQITRSLFVHFKPMPLTADELFDMFPPEFSPKGSNRREAEESALMKWVNYTQAIEDAGGSLEVNSSGGTEKYDITLEDIMSFVTGMPEIPPLGFRPPPTILFQNTSIFPSANTCSNQLHLPLKEMTFEEFKYSMTYGIVNTAGFGKI